MKLPSGECHKTLVNTSAGNGLVQSGNRPLPEPMLTQSGVAIWQCHYSTVSYTCIYQSCTVVVSLRPKDMHSGKILFCTSGLGSNTYLYFQIQIQIRRICICIWSNFKPCIFIWSTVFGVFDKYVFLGLFSKHNFITNLHEYSLWTC